MDFFAHLERLCPVHFPVDANDMAFLDNDEGLDMDQVTDLLVCVCPEYPGHDDVDLDNAGELAITEPTAQHLLAQSTPTAGATSNNHNSPGSHGASGSASADPAASRTPSPKSNTIFTCEHCGSISAKTPRDFNRHLATKKHLKNARKSGINQVSLEDMQSLTPNMGFRCPVSTCNGKTFPRKDNLWRHIARIHGISDGDE